MKELNSKQIDLVSGGESLIDRIHRYEWNSYGVPLVNGFGWASNLFFGTDFEQAEPLVEPAADSSWF